MTNAYLEAFKELQEENTFRGQQWFGKRQDLVEEYGWAVPNDEVIEYLAAFDDLIEVGAGNGYWASLIEDRGASVECFDIDPPDSRFTSVEEANAAELADYIEDRPLLLIWPPYDEAMANESLIHQPSHVLYVGEQRGGCTASDEFFDTIEKEYGLVAKIDIPSFEGVHDNFYHYVRKR